MHYYDFNIKDYAHDTAHLTNDQDLCFRRILDLYYDTEVPISNDIEWVSRKVRSSVKNVLIVLHEFFQESEIGWVNLRADQEIANYHKLSERNSARGKKSAAARNRSKNQPDVSSGSTGREPDVSSGSTGREPDVSSGSTGDQPTSNYEPVTKTPVVPSQGTSSAKDLENNVLNKARSLFNMKSSTPLDSSQQRAWEKNNRAVMATSEEGWEVLQWYFAQKGEIEQYRRKGLAQLLNNWNGEYHRAFGFWQKAGKTKKAAASEPDRWREAMYELYPDNFPSGIDGASFPSAFRLLPDSVQKSISSFLLTKEAVCQK